MAAARRAPARRRAPAARMVRASLLLGLLGGARAAAYTYTDPARWGGEGHALWEDRAFS